MNQRFKYHVHVRDAGFNNPQCAVAHADRYEDARSMAEQAYLASPDYALVEITHAGLIVWGPFVVGSKFAPMGVK